jgi:SAM-dependent methyltransferase
VTTPWSKYGAEFLRDESDPHTGDWAIGQGIDAPDRVMLRSIVKRLARWPEFENKRPRLLDVGCGTAITLDGLVRAKIPCEYTGVDFTPEFIEACRARHPKNHFYQDNLFNLGRLKSEQRAYDIVTARAVLEHNEGEAGALLQLYGTCSKVLFLAFFIAPGAPQSEITEDGFIQRRCDRQALFMAVACLDDLREFKTFAYEHAGQNWEVWEVWRR